MKKYLAFLKDNFNILVSIPPFLGAFWQLIELSKISFSYIRFFSISQLIADGALFLILLIISTICVLLLIFFLKLNDKKNQEDTDESYNNFFTIKKPKQILHVIFYILAFCSFIPILYLNLYFINNLESIFVLLFTLPINIFLIEISLVIFKFSLEHNRNENMISKKISKFIMSIFIILFSFFLINSYWNELNKLMIFPKNLVNLNLIENKLKNNDKVKSIKLLYANDKYIFYNIIDKQENEKVKIIKFEDLFEKE
jgi:preprotein translocase subunit SecG